MSDIVLAMTGASGAVYGVRLLEVLLTAGRSVQFTLSPAAAEVLRIEMQRTVDLRDFALADVLPPSAGHALAGEVQYHHYQDFSAGIASGSFATAGMVICPCSMGTLGALASGLSTNLIHRAADVHLKERRKLILTPREAPLSTIQLENMHKLSVAGAVILPAMPGFYHQPQTVADMVDFVVTRICDQLGVEVKLSRRWGDGDA
jgi:4-hydroxy-3-polyprenylbenzoate decarboxylase